MPNFHLLGLDGKTTPNKKPIFFVLFFGTILDFFLIYSFIFKKKIEVSKKNNLYGQFVLFEVVRNNQS